MDDHVIHRIDKELGPKRDEDGGGDEEEQKPFD
jgi:hypothetical protein